MNNLRSDFNIMRVVFFLSFFLRCKHLPYVGVRTEYFSHFTNLFPLLSGFALRNFGTTEVRIINRSF